MCFRVTLTYSATFVYTFYRPQEDEMLISDRMSEMIDILTEVLSVIS